MHIYSFPFEDCECIVYFIEIFDISLSLILCAGCVKSDTHILNAIIEVLFSGVEIFKHAFMLFFSDCPRGVGFTLIHHDLIFSYCLFICFLFSVSLQVSWNFSCLFCPSNFFLLFIHQLLVDRFYLLFSLSDSFLVLSNVVLLITGSQLLCTFKLFAFCVYLSILQVFSSDFRRHLCEFLNFEWSFGFGLLKQQ